MQETLLKAMGQGGGKGTKRHYIPKMLVSPWKNQKGESREPAMTGMFHHGQGAKEARIWTCRV